MNAQVVQNSILTNVASHFSTGNILIDGFITIILSTLMFRFFDCFNLNIFSNLFQRWYAWWFERYEFWIEYSFTMGEKGWQIDPATKYNEDIIRSVEEYVTGIPLGTKKYRTKINEHGGKNQKDKIKKKAIVSVPRLEVRMPEPYNDIYVKLVITREDKEKVSVKETLLIYSTISKANIDKFLDTCYETYLQKKHDQIIKELNNIYLYTHKYNNYRIEFNKYKIETNSSFDKLFFPEKQEIIEYIDKFENNEVDLDKLSFLLHGPPGTGKTSLIRTISKYTSRSVFYVKLSEIKSFEDAFKIFFDDQLIERNNYFGHIITVPLNKRIIVLEDIDVESQKCHKREDVKMEDSSDTAATTTMDKYTENSSSSSSANAQGKLSLSDILQLFDGIYQSQGLIIIITTNNVDKLDPALIRPGRITVNLNLKEMTRKDALDLIKYHFPNETIDEKFNIIDDYVLTPAYLENACKRVNNLDKLFDLLMEYDA